MNRKKDYLVVLASHINKEEKKDLIVQTIKSLKSEDIDICVVMHSNQFCDDIIKNVNYFYYDYDNEFIVLNDFFNNVERINETNCKAGHSVSWFANDEFYCVNYTKPEYSKAALSLIKNGHSVANLHGYEWIIYLEWDIPVPNRGYKELIETKINELNRNNKKCFYYVGDNGLPIWPAIVIFNTRQLSKGVMFNADWHLSKEKWIDTWGNSGFEYCLKSMILTSFWDDVMEKNIADESIDVWGTNDYMSLSRSYNIKSTFENFSINIFPEKNDSTYDLHLIVFYPYSNPKCKVYDIDVFYDEQRIIKEKNLELTPGQMFDEKLPSILGVKKVKLSYQLINEQNKREESFFVDNLEKIHKYIINYNRFKK